MGVSDAEEIAIEEEVAAGWELAEKSMRACSECGEPVNTRTVRHSAMQALDDALWSIMKRGLIDDPQ